MKIKVIKDMIPIYINERKINSNQKELCVDSKIMYGDKNIYQGDLFVECVIDVDYEINNKFRKDLKQMLKIVKKYDFKNKVGTNMPQINDRFISIIENYLNTERKISKIPAYKENMNKILFNVNNIKVSKDYIDTYTSNSYNFKEFDDEYYSENYERNINKILSELLGCEKE